MSEDFRQRVKLNQSSVREVEITPDMIQVATEVLWESGRLYPYEADGPDQLVVEAMLRAALQPWYRPGQKAPVSGIYEFVASFTPSTVFRLESSTRLIDAGHVFPPVSNQGGLYRLKQEVNPLFTSAASKVAIDETGSRFATAIKHLAER